MTLVSLAISMSCQTSLGFEDPPHIYYGEDVCDQCGMIITEQKFAAAYVTTDGKIRRFDDIGGMVIYDQEYSEEVLKYWVHDFSTEKWVNANKATYVISKEINTPMAHGIIAFINAQAASSRASRVNSVVIDFDTLFSYEVRSGSDVNEPMEMEH